MHFHWKVRVTSLLIGLIFVFFGCSSNVAAETDSIDRVPSARPTAILVSTAFPTTFQTTPSATTGMQSQTGALTTDLAAESTTFETIEWDSTEVPSPPVESDLPPAEDEIDTNLQEPETPRYTILIPVHDGIHEKRNDKAVIDYSHIEEGYFMFRRLADTNHRFKVLVKKGGVTYNYNVDNGEWAAFPLSEGDGSYSVSVHENISGTKYANVLSVSFQAKLDDPFAPFLRPNQHVNYEDAPKTIAKAVELTEGCSGPLEKVDAVYDYITSNINYDYILAATVETGYLPDLDRVLTRKRGICYDYSALMTAMLRCQNVPCKLVFGYVGKIYHAWISVWVEEEGWVQVIYFDGKSWQRMDPTFAAAGTSEEAVKKYVGNGKSYAVKFSF